MRVTNCAETRMQMRRLDRVREGMLCKVWKMVSRGTGHAGRVTLPCGDEEARRPVRRYKGKPFSYCGFLEKAARPTNMRPRRRLIALPYSEL